MPPATVTSPDSAAELHDCLCRVVDKPLAFVLWAYPWGEPGPLVDETGPDTWQRTILLGLEQDLRTREDAVQIAVASGHGIGKGALVAWVIQWAMATRPNLQGVVTANTQSQLFTKTWRELAKWHGLLRPEMKALFTWTGTRYYHALAPETWYVAAIPWSENNSEAFQGAHDKYVLMIKDEASAIPDVIWEAADGSLTTPRAIRLATGNPTRTQGRFRECFPGGKFAHRWRSLQVDSRTCKQTNKAQLNHWVEDYGEESDFVKVRVRGLFPSASEDQFIGADLIALAQRRECLVWDQYAKVLGVDVGHTGSARTVITYRQGPKLHWQHILRGARTDTVAGAVRATMDEVQPDATFVDAIGVGAGVYDLLRHTNHYVIAVQSGARLPGQNPDGTPQPWLNKRAYMWGMCREWLEKFGALPRADLTATREGGPREPTLAEELQLPQFTYAGMYGQLLLESKEDLLERGLASPDKADSLCLTFAEPVRPKALSRALSRTTQKAAGGGLSWGRR